VAGLLPRTAELLVVVLATWRIGAVYQPLFTAFGPKAIEHRLNSSGAAVVVTDAVNRPKLAQVEGCPTIVTVTGAKGEGLVRGDFSFWAELATYSNHCEPVLLGADDPFLLMFTSGTTGPSKALSVPLKAIVAFQSYTRDAVDLRPEDAFWTLPTRLGLWHLFRRDRTVVHGPPDYFLRWPVHPRKHLQGDQ